MYPRSIDVSGCEQREVVVWERVVCMWVVVGGVTGVCGGWSSHVTRRVGEQVVRHEDDVVAQEGRHLEGAVALRHEGGVSRRCERTVSERSSV